MFLIYEVGPIRKKGRELIFTKDLLNIKHFIIYFHLMSHL